MASKASDVKTLGPRRHGIAHRHADRRIARLSRLLAQSNLSMRRGSSTPGAAPPLLWAYLVLLGVLASTHGASGYAQDLLGPCEPGFVQQRGLPRVTPVASRVANTTPEARPGAVRLEWLGHSSFLLTSPTGVRILTDPHGFYRPREVPEAATISNLHVTHSDVHDLPGNPRLLWGLTREQGWNRLALMIGDIGIFNVPSYASRVDPEQSPIQNSIFIFRTGGLCLAHLGNLRHPLTPQQLQRIGRPDVALIPADGGSTLTFADVLTVIEQLRPALVIPIHIDVLEQATFFVQHTGGRYPVRQVAERSLMLSRALLPVATEIVILGGS